ncbi:MAG: ChrB protein [Acidobacteria bacterium]|nr:MAG: ChrB protein [Acidobacteriota bacterium]
MDKLKSSDIQNWLLLVHQLPPKPTNLRVRVWRKLQQLGAVVVKNSIYVLPFSEKTNEDFQWLRQEIASSGGEATVFRANTVEGATDKEIVALFQRARDEDYTRVTAEFEGIAGALREQKRRGHLSPGRLANFEAEAQKLHGELDAIVAIDFFAARGRTAALSAFETCRKVMHDAQGQGGKRSGNTPGVADNVDLSQYQGRRWVTRQHLHIDRLACIWLIKRFVDRRGRFFFVANNEETKGGVAFDMFGVDLTHHGEDCSFETMLKRFGLVDDPGLCGIAEIVHDIDLKDRKFTRKEAAGLDAVVTGLAFFLKNDQRLAQQATGLFDGLYALLGRRAEKKKEKGLALAARRPTGRRGAGNQKKTAT